MGRTTVEKLVEKTERIVKRLAEKGSSLPLEKSRELKKRVKRAQRRRRALLASAKREEERKKKKEKKAAG